MRTRNSDSPKSAAPAKRTPQAGKRSAANAKTQTPTSSVDPPTESPATETATPKTLVTKRANAARAKQVKPGDATSKSEPEQSVVDQVKASHEAIHAMPETKPASSTRIVRKVVRKVIKKTPVSTRAASGKTQKSVEAEKVKNDKHWKEAESEVEEMQNEGALLETVSEVEKAKNEGPSKETVSEVEKAKNEGPSKETGSEVEMVKNEDPLNETINDSKIDEPATSEKPLDENAQLATEDHNIGDLERSLEKDSGEIGDTEKLFIENVEDLSKDVESMTTYVNSIQAQDPCKGKEKEQLKEEEEKQTKSTKDEEEPENMTIDTDEGTNEELKRDDASIDEAGGEKIEALSDQEVHEEFGGEDFADDDVPENEPEAEASDEERVESNAAARERKIRKEREIFVGGLDRDASEEEIRKVFEHAGEVVEVRIHKDPSTNKNKGYAFVQFATKEQASRALSEMKNPVIHGKRCGTAPSEDNDTLFLGNICNTWTKEAIKQKLKDYGIEGVENITLVADPRHEGLSRGFAFIEFYCHAEAMLAYKRLQKPDVIFGHPERTAKVAFAEPLREPDPEVMAQVKSVFVDGLPPHWDEDRVREMFKGFGEIARIMLARNMSTAKRKDFGFVDFATHEAAVSCVEGINTNGLSDGDSKVKVRARLSNPLPKMQAVKGGMCGGFRIGHGGSSTLPRYFGRGFGRGGRPFNQANFQYGRGFNPRGPGHGGRMGFPNNQDFDSPYPPFHGRQNFGRGGRWGFRGAHHQRPVPARSYLDRMRHHSTDRGHGEYDSFRRHPYSFEDGYNRSFTGRHFDDPYLYDDASRGIKRSYYMTDQDPDFAEPSRHRPRLDHSDSAVSLHGSRYRDDLGSDGSLYSQHYYGSDYGGGPYSSSYGDDRSYGRGYYY
ncbi:nucleolin-like [Olea europaea var. sylvestris]|uniref:nucleolin-like n=1 Tax=Olea europaea var. sylvestris TaxID=158386 RepID=UPI000C1D8184|nr:nucleolin-like [Olea europaea var. sylvestris]